MDEVTEVKRVKILSWDFVKSPAGWLTIFGILIVGFVIIWIFRVQSSKDALIEQLQKDKTEMIKQLTDEADFRKIVVSRMETLQQSVNNKETDKLRIYERIKIETRYIDSASVTDLQKWYDARTAESGDSETIPGN